MPQSREQDIEDLLEARYHHHAAGDTDAAVEVTEWACLQLETWGAWERGERLLRETLTWLPQRSQKAAAFLHHLGILAQDRGDDDQALEWYRKSLAILEALGDRAGMARSYHELGMVAQDRGDYDEALAWYRKSLANFEALGDRAGMAGSYHQLGMVAHRRGDDDQALEWTRQSLAIKEVLGDRAGMARSYGQLGMLLTEQGDVEAAVPLLLDSVIILLEIGSPNARISLHWLARQRQMLGDGRFREIVDEHLSEEDADALIGLLNQQEAAEAASATPSERGEGR